MSFLPLTPIETVSVSAGTSTGSSTFTAKGAAVTQVMITNSGNVTAFIKFGVGATTAAVTDTPILAGTIQVFSKGFADTCAAITASGSTTLYFTAGEGS